MTRAQSPLQFPVRAVPPFRLDLTVWALRRRPRNLVDRWDGVTYRRVVVVNGRAMEIAVRQTGAPTAPRLDVTVTPAPRSEADKRQLRRLLDRLLGLRIDLSAWYRTANRDPRLRALADRFRGVKPPRFPTVFEALVNAFACQQFSLEAGLTILNRLAAACGTSLETPANVGHAFPAPEEMIQMLPEELRAIGFSRQKARALLDLAGAITRQELNLESLARESDDVIGQQLAPIARSRSLDRGVRTAPRLRTPAGVSRGRRRCPEETGPMAWTLKTAGLRWGGPGCRAVATIRRPGLLPPPARWLITGGCP